MNYLEITIATAPQGIEDVAQSLTAGGFSDLVLEDQAEFESFLECNRAYWDYIDENLQRSLQGLSQIKLYLEDTDTASLARLQALIDSLKSANKPHLGSLEMHVTPLLQTNWEESWKENYPPQPVAQRLVVLPYWLADTDTDGRLPIILDPGLTFGTGAHPSTQMVMAVMEKILKPGDACLDLGSGSGILSITALRLGAASAIGVDIDPKAEDIARENAAYNGFGAPQFTALTGNVTEDTALLCQLEKQTYQLVFVNIVADVIIGIADYLPRFLQPDSRVILSGIIDVRLDDVLSALKKAGLEPEQILQKEDWRCICAKRRLP